MASLNKVFLLGNLTRDPEVRYIPSGTAVADMRLAVSETYKNRDGELTETTCFVDVVVWGRQAETCGEYLRKGSPALIEGRLQLDSWKSKEGESRSKIRVRADRVQFVGGPRGGASVRDGDEGGRERSGGDGPADNEPPPRDDGPPDDDDNLPF
jgi:single-strand DNA-binding protein